MKTKKIRITIVNEYVDVTIKFDKDENEESMIASAFCQAYVAGAMKVDIQDTDNKEHCHEQRRLQ